MATRNTLDRLQTVFLWITIIVPIAFDIHSSFHPELDIERALLSVVLFVLWLFVIIIYAFFALRHNLSAKMMMLPLLTIVFWIWLAPLLLKWFPIGDYVHLAVEYKNYEEKIKDTPNSRLEFNWGGAGWAAGPSFDRMLVYDPTDRLLQVNKIKDSKLRKESRSLTGNGQEYYRRRLFTRHLFGHFYLVVALYQA